MISDKIKKIIKRFTLEIELRNNEIEDLEGSIKELDELIKANDKKLNEYGKIVYELEEQQMNATLKILLRDIREYNSILEINKNEKLSSEERIKACKEIIEIRENEIEKLIKMLKRLQSESVLTD